LIRRRKLTGWKLGRDWIVSRNAVEERKRQMSTQGMRCVRKRPSSRLICALGRFQERDSDSRFLRESAGEDGVLFRRPRELRFLVRLVRRGCILNKEALHCQSIRTKNRRIKSRLYLHISSRHHADLRQRGALSRARSGPERASRPPLHGKNPPGRASLRHGKNRLALPGGRAARSTCLRTGRFGTGTGERTARKESGKKEARRADYPRLYLLQDPKRIRTDHRKLPRTASKGKLLEHGQTTPIPPHAGDVRFLSCKTADGHLVRLHHSYR